jgi:hypothetical protein
MASEKRTDKYPRMHGSTIAYETHGRENFDYQVQFVFDYSDLTKKTRQVKKELSDLNYALDKIFAVSGVKSDGFLLPSMRNKARKSIDGTFSTTLAMLPDELRIQQTLKPAMAQIGEDGKKVMTNFNNRIQTRRMKESIRYNARVRSQKYVVNIGWTELWYKYFGFQENGTKHISPLNSVLHTYLNMVPKVMNYTSRLLRSYTRANGDYLTRQKVDYK